ncbi:MAG: hypothetical protein LIO41_08285 [Ruminococcus sp.]|nr:hypothetical protein [Ruminococcus sp.]
MGGYYFFDFYNDEDYGGYRFRLFPSNNNSQPLGISILYPTPDACKNALRDFRSLIKDSNMCVNENKYVRIEPNENQYIFKFFDEDGNEIFYRKLPYYQKTNCRNGINRVIQHIDAPIK